ncbi:HAMP domain-containing sensor histidine kinase [Oscillospiraceae bacterium WX1]
MKRNGIFVKTFIYTAIFAVLLIGVTAFLFSAQIISYYRMQNINHITRSYQRIVTGARDGTDIVESAKRFYEKNQSLPFLIRDKEGNTLFATPDLDLPGNDDMTPPNVNSSSDNEKLAPGGGKSLPLTVYSDSKYEIIVPGGDFSNYNDGLTLRVAAALLLILAAGLLGAFVFARQMSKPIKALADATRKMANLEDVSPPPSRADELGALADHVHSMYIKLKDEIMLERELEETQRYFFSAASHELKTPIAATSVLLEGMIENVGDYKDHPKYLRECVKMMDAQSKTISEILEIVSLNDGKIVPVPKELDISHIVADMLPDFQTLSEANGQRIVTHIPAGQTCLVDPIMLQKVLSNIILNAVQNTPESGEIQIWSEPVADKYHFSVLNTGTRIDDAVLPKLFDPFYLVDKARRRKNERSGLGLTIVQKTLESMKIDFALENTPDGVIFWMNLPKANHKEKINNEESQAE